MRPARLVLALVAGLVFASPALWALSTQRGAVRVEAHRVAPSVPFDLTVSREGVLATNREHFTSQHAELQFAPTGGKYVAGQAVWSLLDAVTQVQHPVVSVSVASVPALEPLKADAARFNSAADGDALTFTLEFAPDPAWRFTQFAALGFGLFGVSIVVFRLRFRGTKR